MLFEIVIFFFSKSEYKSRDCVLQIVVVEELSADRSLAEIWYQISKR